MTFFSGFTSKTFTFLNDIKTNNNKPWFEEHKQLFIDHVQAPLHALVSDLGPAMQEIDPYFETTPNKCISRIYRDVRFSKNKQPYKSHMWITFKQPQKEWEDSPAFFFEIAEDSYSLGMGLFDPSPATMTAYRKFIDTYPKDFNEIIEFYPKQQTFTLEGNKYKRILDPSKSPVILDWYQRKNPYLYCNRKLDDIVSSPTLVDFLKKEFATLSDLYNFFWQIKLDIH